MEFVYRKAKFSDSKRIAELFEEMLRTIYHTKEVDGYEDGYLNRFFSEGDDLIDVAELGKEVVAFLPSFFMWKRQMRERISCIKNWDIWIMRIRGNVS